MPLEIATCSFEHVVSHIRNVLRKAAGWSVALSDLQTCFLATGDGSPKFRPVMQKEANLSRRCVKIPFMRHVIINISLMKIIAQF